jgi:hypothetical protein
MLRRSVEGNSVNSYFTSLSNDKRLVAFGKQPEEYYYSPVNNKFNLDYLWGKQLPWLPVVGSSTSNGIALDQTNPLQLLPECAFPVNMHYKKAAPAGFGVERFLRDVLIYPNPENAEETKDKLREKLMEISGIIFNKIVDELKTQDAFKDVTIDDCKKAIADFINNSTSSPLVEALRSESMKMMPEYKEMAIEGINQMECNFKSVVYDLIAKCAPSAIREMQNYIEQHPNIPFAPSRDFKSIFETTILVDGRLLKVVNVPMKIDELFNEKKVDPESQKLFFAFLQEEMSKTVALVRYQPERQKQSEETVSDNQKVGTTPMPKSRESRNVVEFESAKTETPQRVSSNYR